MPITIAPLLSIAIALVLAPIPAAAHAVSAAPAAPSQLSELIQIALIGTAAGLYALGLLRIRRQTGHRIVSKAQLLAFSAGIVTIVIALLSPLDTLSGELFSAHMAQHLILILVAPPLLVWSRPALVFLWAMPRSWRKPLGAAWNSSRLAGFIRVLMQPLAVAILFCGTFAFWHLPRPYEWGLSNNWIHALEHLSFFLTALMFWTVVIEPSGRRRLGYAATLLYIAAIAVVSGLPGALMLLSPVPLFTVHSAGAARFGLTALEDQQLAGLIMWIPAGLAYLAPMAWLFANIVGDKRGRGRVAMLVMALTLVPLGVTGCFEDQQGGGGDAGQRQAKTLIAQYGCGACHEIPHVQDAHGQIGPPLGGIANRAYIAGMVENNRTNMVRWLMDPQAIAPGNVMPNMGVKQEEAMVISEYLSTLR